MQDSVQVQAFGSMPVQQSVQQSVQRSVQIYAQQQFLVKFSNFHPSVGQPPLESERRCILEK
jgi:hypothetical protein